MVFPLDDDSVGSTPITSDDVPLSVTGERGSGKRKCSRSSLPPSLLNAARRRVTKSCELSKLDGVGVSCEISSRCPCVLLNLSRIGADVWLFTFLLSWSVGPTIDRRQRYTMEFLPDIFSKILRPRRGFLSYLFSHTGSWMGCFSSIEVRCCRLGNGRVRRLQCGCC